MKVVAFDGGDAGMRNNDHEAFADLYIGGFGSLDPGAKFDEEGASWGWKDVSAVKAADTALPTTCKMERP
jgi:branched-chain amino acid transport system substrate-binding protein